MRKTRPQDYDPNFQQTKGPQPEEIDMGDVVPMKEHSPIAGALEEERTVRRSTRTLRTPRTARTERNGTNAPYAPQKRQIKRHSFDIYIDQLEELRVLKIEAMRRGEERGLSKMTREALEAYLKKTNRITERTARTGPTDLNAALVPYGAYAKKTDLTALFKFA